MGLYAIYYNPVYSHWAIMFQSKLTKLHCDSEARAVTLIDQLNNSDTGFEIILHASDWKIIVVEKNFMPKEFNYPDYISPLTNTYNPLITGFQNSFNTLARAELYLSTQLPQLTQYIYGKVLSLV